MSCGEPGIIDGKEVLRRPAAWQDCAPSDARHRSRPQDVPPIIRAAATHLARDLVHSRVRDFLHLDERLRGQARGWGGDCALSPTTRARGRGSGPGANGRAPGIGLLRGRACGDEPTRSARRCDLHSRRGRRWRVFRVPVLGVQDVPVSAFRMRRSGCSRWSDFRTRSHRQRPTARPTSGTSPPDPILSSRLGLRRFGELACGILETRATSHTQSPASRARPLGCDRIGLRRSGDTRPARGPLA